jgi:outer membrane usher protein
MASALLLTSPAAAQTTPNEAPDQVFPLDVTINGAAGGIWPILRREGVIYAPAEAFTRWRLEMRPGSPSMAYRGLTYFAVSSVPGMEGRINEAAATLELKVPADLFAATKLSRDAAPDTVSISPVVPTAYFNYDLSYIRSSARTGPTLNTLGMLGEAGFSSGLGVFTQTFSTRNESNSESSVTRLETTYRRDFPGRGLTLTVGDATLRTGLLGRNAYFGGLQIGTNFALSPLTNRQPVPLITGQAAAPSMVQLYVNDILRQTSQVPAGPFSLDNLPVLTGNGQVTVVVRDILGRETLLTQPFLITADLLAPGLSDWSVEAGKLRLDMGLKNANYADTFVSGMWRRGMTTNWTLETRAESTRDRTSVGAATLNAFGSNWLARAGWMGTHDQRAGSGSRWLVGVDYPGFDRNAAVTLEGATRRYRSLGELPELDPVRMQLAGQGDLGRLGVALAIQKREILPQRTSLSFNYSKTFRENWQFNAYFTRTMGITSGTTAGVLLSIPLGRRVSSSHSVQVRH